MSKKKWYKSKSRVLSLLLLIYLIAIQFEWAKNRYDPETTIKDIQTITDLPTTIKTNTLDGHTISYLTIGKNKNKPLLVLVHGSPGSLVAYEDYYTDKDLLNKFDIISIDRLGFGYSDFGKSISSLEHHSKLINAILEDHKDQKIILVGHSMGGPTIAKVAMDYPENVDGLLMIAPSISPDLEPSNTWRKFFNFLPLRVLTPDALRICNQEIIPLKEELVAMMDSWENIKVPVTIVQGKSDKLVPQGNADFAKSMLTNSRNVVVKKIDGGHFILWNETAIIKNEMLNLLQQLK